MYSHNLDCLNDHIEVLLKIITNKIEKTNSYNINLNLLEINTSTKVTWIIPEKNFIDANYIVKEEKKVEKINEIINNHFTQSKPDKETKTKKLGFSQIFNTNFHIKYLYFLIINNSIKNKFIILINQKRNQKKIFL